MEATLFIEPVAALFFMSAGILTLREWLKVRPNRQIEGNVERVDESRITRYVARISFCCRGKLTIPYSDPGQYKPGQKIKGMCDGSTCTCGDCSSVAIDNRLQLLIGFGAELVLGLTLVIHLNL